MPFSSGMITVLLPFSGFLFGISLMSALLGGGKLSDDTKHQIVKAVDALSAFPTIVWMSIVALFVLRQVSEYVERERQIKKHESHKHTD